MWVTDFLALGNYKVRFWRDTTLCLLTSEPEGRGYTDSSVHDEVPTTVARAVWVNQLLALQSVLPLCYNSNDKVTTI